MKKFDIDSMSSGEKGLCLTFLLLRLSAIDGGVIFIDEPELHLNSAVCAKILPYLIDLCSNQPDVQLFVCTHSPEIVRDAFERDDCALFHLRSGNDLSPVLKQDNNEVFEILSRLGNSPADVLFSRGNVFVEGDDDVAILQIGYADCLSGYKVTSLGGRNEVENEVKRLQDEDNSGKLAKRQLFIFDNDRKISGLLSTNSVKVSQLQRYCIENYLLDDIVLFDMVSAHAQKTMVSRGEFTQLLEQLALAQLDNVVIRQVYAELEPESPGLRGAEIKGKKLSEVATLLSSRILRLRQQIAEIDIPSWEADFVLSCETKRREVEAEWRLEWKTLASGKQIIDDLYAQFQISMKKIEFKKSIMRRLREKQADSWRIIDQILRANLA